MSPDTLLYSTYSATDDVAGSTTNGDPGQFSVTVYRDSDNAMRSFTPAEVADGTANTWRSAAGAANGFVRRAYDQSVTALDVSNLNHADQTTTASMPKLFDSSTGLILENGKAAMEFDGVNDYFNLETFTHSDFTAFCVTGSLVYASLSINTRFFDVITNLGSLQLLNDNTTSSLHMKNSQWQFETDGTRFEGQVFNQNLMSSVFKSTENLLFLNGLQLNVSPTAGLVGAGGTTGKIGVRADLVSSTFINGNYQTLIIYPSDQSTNRPGIETAINNEYSIYP
jgi:hypothetical protein